MEKTRSEYSGDRLDLRDIGVTAEELKALQPKPDNVVNINSYRTAKDLQSIDSTVEDAQTFYSSERKKKIKAILLAGATLIGSAKLAVEMFREKIHPVSYIQSAEQLEDASIIDIEDIKPGDVIVVSPYSYTVTGGNVRTSPQADTANNLRDENLVDADLTGKVLAHPIEVADKTNPSNANWFIFYDSEGQKFAINGQNLEVVHGQNTNSGRDLQVTIDRVTNRGIIAHDDTSTMQVAVVVDALDTP